MACCTENHLKVDPETGVGKCSVPMWSFGVPNGFCDVPAYGEPIRPATRFTPGLACHAHGGPHKREGA